MQAAAVDAFPAGPESLKSQTLPLPQAGPDEVLIRVESAGVGVWDPFELEGGFAKMMGITPRFPYVPGADGAGTVAAVGSNVGDIKAGDRVYAISLANPKGGFYAQYAAVNAKDVSHIPGGLSIEQAGAFPVDAITALCGLDDTLKLQSGESILIFGASGGIGHLAVQLAKRMGARVFAVASGDDGVRFVKSLGADAVVDGHKEDVESAARAFAPNGIDTALITAGGEAANKALRTIRDGGRVAYPNGVEPAPQARSGVRVQSYDGEPSPQRIRKLNALVEKQPFQVHIARTFPLDQAADALRTLDEHYLGKLALRPS
jgi:NADPH:quinone reductase-like Zn-dependent oxidoreductase